MSSETSSDERVVVVAEETTIMITAAKEHDTTDTTLDELTQQVQAIHIESIKEKATKAKLSESLSHIAKEIHTLAEWIHQAQRIVVVTGAGVSCAAGIPDFRSPGTGLYDNLQQYDLPFPEAVFDLDFFRRKPQPFVSLAHALWPSKHLPTLTHSFLALMAHESKRKLLRNYSQNIDGLEFLAGMPAEHLVECHGHFRSSSCIDCRKKMDQTKVEVDILQHSRPTYCHYCGGLVKPDIVFFGEGLPDRFHNLVRKDTSKADLCIVMGTSLQVAPVSMIPDMVNCKVALVNREEVGTDVDLFCQGDCDEIIRDLAHVLGWHDELEELHYDMIRMRKEENGKAMKQNAKGKHHAK